jgi:hypothetical protein
MAPAWPGQLSLAKSKRRVWPRPVSAAAGSQRSKPRDECPALLPPRLAAGSNDPAPWAGQRPRCVPPLGVGESARGPALMRNPGRGLTLGKLLLGLSGAGSDSVLDEEDRHGRSGNDRSQKSRSNRGKTGRSQLRAGLGRPALARPSRAAAAGSREGSLDSVSWQEPPASRYCTVLHTDSNRQDRSSNTMFGRRMAGRSHSRSHNLDNTPTKDSRSTSTPARDQPATSRSVRCAIRGTSYRHGQCPIHCAGQRHRRERCWRDRPNDRREMCRNQAR